MADSSDFEPFNSGDSADDPSGIQAFEGMNRLHSIANNDRREYLFEDTLHWQNENRVRWSQLICEQLGDGYIVFSQWQCLGLGGAMWRDPGCGTLYREKNEEWLSMFHEEDQGVVALGLADPTTHTFPIVRVFDRRDHIFKRARLRLFYPPFEGLESLFAVVLQLEAESTESPSDATVAESAHCGIFEATSAEMLVVDVRTGRIENANQAFLEENQLQRRHVVGVQLADLPVIDPDVANVLLGTIELGERVRRRPIVLNPSHRESREMLLDVNKLEGHADVRVLHFIDVTVHNSATRHLSLILNNLPVGVFTKDPHDGTYLLSNVAADAFFNRSKPLRGLHDEGLFPPETREAFARVDRQVAEEGRAIEVQEFPVQMPGAEPRLFDIVRAPVRDACGKISRILGMVREVTDDVRARNRLTIAKEEADHANRAKDEFLVNMGHEIRTPMNAILGFSKLLAETELDADQLDLIEEVQTSGTNLSAIIDSILDLSQISGGALELEVQEFDLEGLCEEMIEMHQSEARAKGLDLLLVFDPRTPARVLGDPLRLRQILSNVVGNAIKFTESGWVELLVGGNMGETDKVRVHFAIRDTGIGIAPSKLQSIFEPFVQADSSETRSYEGTGLGLTLSQRLAEAMGSRMSVESELGQGSVFEFSVDFDCEHAESLRDIEHPAPPITLHILEESEHLAVGVSKPLEQWGLKTVVAHRPNDLGAAVQLVKKGGCAYVNWKALNEDDRRRLPSLICASRFPGRWIVSMFEAEAHAALPDLVSHIQYVETNPRTSHLRMAVIEAAASEEISKVEAIAVAGNESNIVRDDAAEKPKMRALIIDDDGMHRRAMVKQLRKLDVIVETCGAEHDAYVLASVHAYDVVFFESSFVGIETPRMLAEIRRSSSSKTPPQFVGLAFTHNRDREESLEKLGVATFLSKPIEPDALQACLRALS